MKLKDDGRSAFPHPAVASDSELIQDSPGDDGMTLRQWYAGQALSGFIAGDAYRYKSGEGRRLLAGDAVKLADALIAELDKET